MKAIVGVLLVALFSGCISSTETPNSDGQQEPPRIESTQSISWTPENPFELEEVTFSLATDLTPVQLLWQYGDGTSGPGASHVYKQSGKFSISVQFDSEQGVRAAYANLTVQPRPTAKPVPSPSEPGAPVEPTRPPENPGDLEITDVPISEAPFSFDSDGNIVSLIVHHGFSLNAIRWGDGTVDQELSHKYAQNGNWSITVAFNETLQTETFVETSGFIPHVVVGIADSGFNVYHQVYRRPHLTQHPCTYIEGYPCSVPALNLTLDAATWDQAFAADLETWRSIENGDRYWIPGTNIIGAICDHPYTWDTITEAEDPTVGEDLCILDDTSMHGTGTSSSVLSENPDALLVIAEGSTLSREEFATQLWPVDIISHSWGSAVPTPLPCSGRYSCTPWLFEVTASGNEGAFPVVLDGGKSFPNYINVGAADAGSKAEPGISGFKTMDYVSEYCRPTAQTKSFDGTRAQYCGTSFSAPTFAGALSRIVFELRMESGYSGSIEAGFVDPILGITMADVRDAINHTATYEPSDKWNDPDDDVPLVAPWYQWGWGYFDSTRVPAALDCINLGQCPDRPAETVAYMEALWLYRNTYHEAMPYPT